MLDSDYPLTTDLLPQNEPEGNLVCCSSGCSNYDGDTIRVHGLVASGAVIVVDDCVKRTTENSTATVLCFMYVRLRFDSATFTSSAPRRRRRAAHDEKVGRVRNV